MLLNNVKGISIADFFLTASNIHPIAICYHFEL